MTPEIANSFFMHIAEGVEAELQKSGYSLIICNTSENTRTESKRIDLLSDQQVDGIILIPSTCMGDHFSVLKSRGIPTVLVDRLVTGFTTDAVLADNRQGSYAAAVRFFESGVKHIGYVGGTSDLTTARERWEGFCGAHADYGIPLDERAAKFGNFHVDSGYALAGEILSLKNAPSHLFIANYFMHVGVTRYLIESGIGRQRPVQTASFDSLELSPLLAFSAFTVTQPMHEMGAAAAGLLLDRISNGESATEFRTMRLKTTIVSRKTPEL